MGPAGAHDIISTKVTWSREISRIVYKRCASCHRESGSAFSLMRYQEARPWAKAIKEETLERRMPPWGAVKGFGYFRDDQSLTQEEIELISDWVEGGAPEGDPSLLPKPDTAAARPAPMPVAGLQVLVERELVLERPVRVVGVRAGKVPEGASFQVYAERPDGSVEPMLWVYNYRPAFQHPYYYAVPLSFPAGTTIRISEPDAGTAFLLVVPPSINTSETGSRARISPR
jgi:hypothetical protein